MSSGRTWAEMPPATQQAAIEIAAILLHIRQRQAREQEEAKCNHAAGTR